VGREPSYLEKEKGKMDLKEKGNDDRPWPRKHIQAEKGRPTTLKGKKEHLSLGLKKRERLCHGQILYSAFSWKEKGPVFNFFSKKKGKKGGDR